MTPAQVAHIMPPLPPAYEAGKCDADQPVYSVDQLQAYARAAVEAALRDAPQAEIDAITELNHAQWLALENVRHLAARNRNEEWAQHMLRWCTEAGNAARILRSPPSAPTAVEPVFEQAARMLRKYHRLCVEVGRGDSFWLAEILSTEAALRTTPSAPTAVEPDERTPQDYAIEHAEYMAQSAAHLIACVNDLALSEQQCEDGEANPSDVDAARESLTEAQGHLKSSIYEFRKRRDRASKGTK